MLSHLSSVSYLPCDTWRIYTISLSQGSLLPTLITSLYLAGNAGVVDVHLEPTNLSLINLEFPTKAGSHQSFIEFCLTAPHKAYFDVVLSLLLALYRRLCSFPRSLQPSSCPFRGITMDCVYSEVIRRVFLRPYLSSQ